MKINFFIVLLILSNLGVSQGCLSLLDNAQQLVSINPNLAEDYLERLTLELDSSRCNPQIGYSETYHNIGLIYLELDKRRSALEYLNRAIELKLMKSDSFSMEMLPFYDSFFAFHRNQGELFKASRYLNLTQKVFKENRNDKLIYINHLLKSGIFYRETGLFDEGGVSFTKSLELSENIDPKNDSLLGSVLIEYATLQILTGEFDQASRKLERAISILRTNNPALRSKAVDRLAKVKIESGNLVEAESNLLSNISFKSNAFPNDSLLQVESINNLGILYFRISDLDRAEKYFRQLIEFAGKEPTIRPYGLNNLGTILMRRGDYDGAIQIFSEAADIFKQLYGTLHQEYSNVLSNLAGAYTQKVMLEESMSLYSRVLDLDKALYGEKHPKYASSLTNLALTYAQLGFYKMAQKFLHRSLEIKRNSFGDHYEVAKNLNDLGLVNLAIGDTLLALHSFDEALSINLKHFQNIFPVLTDNQRALAFGRIRFDLQRFSSLTFSGDFINSEWAEKALDYNINSKGILFYASEKLRRLISVQNDPRTEELYYWWRKRGIDLANAYLKSEEELEANDISISELEEECHRLEKQLALKINSTSLQSNSNFVSWKDISNSLDSTKALVEILQYGRYQLRIDEEGIKQGFLDASHYVCFVIKEDGQLETVTWSDETNFDNHFKYYRNALRFDIKDQHSYQNLWSEIDTHLEGMQKIYFAGDGQWHLTNPSIFYDGLKDEYVADKYHLVSITSGKDLVTKESTTWSRTAQIVGNPDFSNFKTSLTQLKGAEEEARVISGILKKEKWKVSTHIGKRATKDVLIQAMRPGIVHIATHGYFFSDENVNPMINSGLYLASDKEDVDGRLTALEATNLILDNTRLVVLSACETGLGEIQSGEGVFGLQRALLTAGAENLIITLVKVNDQATMEFMSDFYLNYTQLNNVEEAFFKTRTEFKNNYPKTIDWGAFVLVAKH